MSRACPAVIFAALSAIILAIPAFAEICSIQLPHDKDTASVSRDLEIINQSDTAINGIYITTGESGRWSDNLIGESPLKTGQSAYVDIGRASIPGYCSMKIVYDSKEEKIWERLPITEIYSIKISRNNAPEYERIRPGT